MWILLIVLICYIISCFGAFKYVQFSYYHPEGKWTKLSPTAIDIFWVFMPFFNSMLTLDFITLDWQEKNPDDDCQERMERKWKEDKNNFFKPRIK